MNTVENGTEGDMTMLYIEKNKIEELRFAIGKIAFILNYSEFRFVKNIGKISMSMLDPDGESCFVSVFQKDSSLDETANKYVFYQRVRGNTKGDGGIGDALSQPAIDTYNRLFKAAFVNPKELIYELENYPEWMEISREVLLTQEEVKKLFIEQLGSHIGYKYRSKESIDKNSHGVCNGTISFLPPSYMNDPFDCNCVFRNNADMSNYFKLFCMAPTWKNILMWSYYADNHEGYCLGYRIEDILNELEKNPIDNGIVVFGHVDYKQVRPNYVTATNTFSFTQMNTYIQVAFTKFKKWEHENESRFVIISPPKIMDNNDKSDGTSSPKDPNIIEITVPIVEAYAGCMNDSKWISSGGLTGAGIVPSEVIKHDTDYDLII